MSGERTIVFYHGENNCPDGMSGAYAAWKKFGDAAEYVPLKRSEPVPEDVAEAHLYFIDFTYEQEVMDVLVAKAAKVTVLDHHKGIESVITSMPEYRYSTEQSGATIAWDYFFPGVAQPALFKYVEDDDLFRFALPDTRAVMCYVTMQPATFESWDAMVRAFDNPASSEQILVTARVYAEYFEKLADLAVQKAQLVSFEGYECYFASCHPLKTLKSLVGNKLAKKTNSIGLVVTPNPLGFGVSIRAVEGHDVAAIAKKYGGNGHILSAGFMIPNGSEMPWSPIKADEDSRD